MEKRKDIPTGSYYVQTSRLNRRGTLLLYVAIENKVERIETDLTELNQDYVYLKETNNGYDVSLEPFKKVNKNNENITIHINEELVGEKKRGRKKAKKEETSIIDTDAETDNEIIEEIEAEDE
ncbi:MAG: hypothetical protein J6S85_21120 [Methanobrevibacter sp.]|nr:hypothetical protein [Methanobrevibacter sp.]